LMSDRSSLDPPQVCSGPAAAVDLRPDQDHERAEPQPEQEHHDGGQRPSEWSRVVRTICGGGGRKRTRRGLDRLLPQSTVTAQRESLGAFAVTGQRVVNTGGLSVHEGRGARCAFRIARACAREQQSEAGAPPGIRVPPSVAPLRGRGWHRRTRPSPCGAITRGSARSSATRSVAASGRRTPA